MKIRINTKIIGKLRPCKDRLENWLLYYKDFDGDIIEFLDLTNITHEDKIWMICKLLPEFLIEVFVIDCSLIYYYDSFAYIAINEYARSGAYDVAAYAAAVYAAKAINSEKQRQIESLIYLIQTTSKQALKSI